MAKKKGIKRHAFAILLYRKEADGSYSVFLAKANGPRYWRRGQKNCWGLPKGRGDAGETAFESAKREFLEEIGVPLPSTRYQFFMHHVRPNARRQITVFKGRVTRSHDVYFAGSNTQLKKWKGTYVEYPEISDARWFPVKEAMNVVLPGQRAILKSFKKSVKVKKKSLVTV